MNINSSYHHIAKRTLIITLCVCMLFILSNTIICKVFYNPYEDFKSTSSIFSMTSQLLSPSITWSYLDSYKPNTLLNFSNYSQQFTLRKFSYVYSEMEKENTGILKYSFGKVNLSEYDNKLGIHDLTTTQGVFMEQNVDDLKSYWEDVDLNGYYEVWFKFASPISSTDLQNKYINLLDNSISRPKESGVIWIPVKTSDNASDVCIGMQGNYSWHYMNTYNLLAGNNNFYSMDSYARELVFRQSLQFLIDHPKDVMMFLKSGLYKNAENIDISKKMKYINNHGISCLGLVAYLRGDTLLSFENDASMSIVNLFSER